MAQFSNVMWIAVMAILFPGAFPDDTPLNIDLNVPFDCDMDISNAFWMLECVSKPVEKGILSTKFYYLKLKGKFNATSPVLYRDLLNSTSMHESEFFICDAIWRVIIHIDPASLKGNCKNFRKLIAQSITDLNESFITSLSITNVPVLEVLMNVLYKSSRLDEVRICENYLPNLIDFPVHPNNSISTLILKQNEIENINGEALSNLPNLTLLDLSKNLLKLVNQSLFGALTRISTLDLSYNLIEEMNEDTFSNLSSLRNIYLQNNNLNSISETIFSFNNLLQIVDISNNSLKVLPPTIFHNLTDLRNISCANCSLYALDRFLFVNSPKIQLAVFDHNYIEVIPEDLFQNQKYIMHVDLGFNRIKELSRYVFSFHPYLKFLKLSNNRIRSLKKGTFDNAPNIYYLDLSENKITTLTDEDVKIFTDLEHFDLRNNEIQIVELGQMQNVLIRRLFLSNNLVAKLNIKWKKLVYLENLLLDDNQLTSLDLPPCIPSVKLTITFSFRYNNITRVNIDSLLEDEIKVKTDKKMMASCFFNGLAKNFVDLSYNPLSCDCHLFPLYKYVKEKSPRRYQLETFVNVGNLTCVDPQFETNRIITSLEDDAFRCLFTEECPEPCICGIRGKDNAAFVNCSGSYLENVPQKIPKATTVLYFNENKLSSMHTLNSKYWESIKELHLDRNYLATLNDWNYPESLRYLSVRGNNLTTLPTSLMNFIANQTNFLLYFGDNDKNCTCDREELKNFITTNIQFVGDAENIVCEVINNGTTAYLPLTSIPDNELCPTDFVGLNDSQKSIIISLCVFFSFFIAVLLTYYKHRQVILSFFYIHCDLLFRLCYKEEEYDEDKIFDAFVAYSSSDRDIVMDMLQELENHPPFFKLCIHERDWVPGRFICDNILSSVQSSKRTIILLSNSFITSPWFNLELRAAVSKMSKDKISRIIIVLAEKVVQLTDIDPELRHVISKRTYLVWKERWFWEKLRYAMPRIKHVKENQTAMRRSRKCISKQPLILEPV